MSGTHTAHIYKSGFAEVFWFCKHKCTPITTVSECLCHRTPPVLVSLASGLLFSWDSPLLKTFLQDVARVGVFEGIPPGQQDR